MEIKAETGKTCSWLYGDRVVIISNILDFGKNVFTEWKIIVILFECSGILNAFSFIWSCSLPGALNVSSLFSISDVRVLASGDKDMKPNYFNTGYHDSVWQLTEENLDEETFF